jgi:hypothetical protein
MLEAEEKGLAMSNPCTIFHRSGLVHGKTYARLSEPDHASDEGTGLITSLWYWA